MTPLADALVRRIAAGGPITVADYMAECLMHPVHGYYSTRDPFGQAGDFTTAPEISQMFGELIGLCLAQSWLDQGSPAPFALAELGPGRGTLMADLLRATRRVPGFHAAAHLVLVETSPVLRRVQAKTLASHAHNLGAIPKWVDATSDLPVMPLFLIANEFFDALPIRQFQRAEAWHERLVGVVDGRLTFGLSPPLAFPPQGAPFDGCPRGGLVEVCPAAHVVMRDVAARIQRHGGVALIVDYGGWRSLGDTLQALRDHAPDDPLAHPGSVDLTAHVDFEALCLAACLPHSGLTAQGDLLRRLGIDARAAILAKGLSGAGLASHHAAHRRLTDGAEMGSLFKAIAIHAPGSAPPPGFDPHPDA
jgi:NADH dehydrogenase [ubiquinone] 1 alpha subcomplex assembly factor 7